MPPGASLRPPHASLLKRCRLPLELLDALAQALGQFWQLFGAKKNQHDSKNQNDFSRRPG